MKVNSTDPRANYYLAADVRELDRLAIEDHGIPGFTLMQRAGQAAFNALMAKWPETTAIICFCGSGNNGGDGYVIATLAAARGLQVRIIAVGNPDSLKDDARLAFDATREHNINIEPISTLSAGQLTAGDKHTVLIDAMLGTGLSGNVRGDYLKAIKLINDVTRPVLAVDIPSGLCSDTGVMLGDAVHADLTMTFIGRKLGQVLGDGPQVCGELLFDDLAVPGEIYNCVSPATP